MSFTSPSVAAADRPADADRWRDVYLAAGARGLSYAGDLVAATALVLALQERGASGYVVSALLLAAAGPMVVMAPLGGRLADRYDSRVLLTAISLAQAACCVAMVFVTSPVPLIALAALLSAGLAVTQPTLGALTPDMVSPAKLPHALAIGQTANSLGMVMAPALAGLLFGSFGVRVPLAIDAVSYLALAGVGLLLRTRRNAPGGRPTTPSAPGGGPAAAPVWRLRDDRLLAYLIPAIAIVICVISSVNVVSVFFVRDTLGASAIAYGLLDAAWMGAMLVGAWLLTRFAASDRRLAGLMMANLAVTSGVLLVASTVPGVGWLGVVFLIGGLSNGAENTIGQLLIARRVPGAARGRAIGLFMSAVSAASAIGYVAAGPLLDLLGPRASIAVAGAAGLVAVAVLTAPTLRGARPTDDPQVTRLKAASGPA